MKDVEQLNDFQAGRSCRNSVLSLKQVTEKQLAHNLSTHIVFIDLTKAYDSIALSKLWRTMAQQGISNKNIKAVQQLYTNMTANIKTSGRFTSEIAVSKGLEQGCCIIPSTHIVEKKVLRHGRPYQRRKIVYPALGGRPSHPSRK